MNGFAIVTSSDAPKRISLQELHSYTERVIADARQAGKSVPPILVMHVSESVASVVGVGRAGVIRHNRHSGAEMSSYYEIWLVGQAVFADYVLALQGILNDLKIGNALSGPTALAANSG